MTRHFATPTPASKADDMEIKGKSDQHRAGNKLVILPDFSPAAGIVSFAKCMQLAENWPKSGQVVFAVSGITPPMAQKRIVDAGYECIKLANGKGINDTVSELQSSIARMQPAAVIVDGQSFKPAALATLEMHVGQVLWLCEDEIATRPEYYIGHSIQQTQSKKIVSVARRIAVIVDGADEDSLTSEILNSLDKITTHSFSVDICISSSNPQHQLLLDLASASEHSVRIHRDASRIESLMPRFDLGIVNFKSGSLQLAQHGVPMIGISAFSDPVSLRETLQNNGAIETVHIACDEEILSDSIRSMVRNRDRRQQLSNAAMRCVDGKGASRLIAMLTGEKTTLRKAS